MGKRNRRRKELTLKVSTPEKKASLRELLQKEQENLHIVFNFSFMSNNKSYNFENANFENADRCELLNRIAFLSMNDFVATLAFNKKLGFEKLKFESIKKQKLGTQKLHDKFSVGKPRYEKCGNDFWIFRLYPNNVPKPIRIIGKMDDYHFYLMFIDIEHDLYSG